MNCPHCHTAHCVKNGTSRHGHQRWRCQECHKTFGDQDRRWVAPEKKAAALAQYLEGVGQRATERLIGVSHNSITNWVKLAIPNFYHASQHVWTLGEALHGQREEARPWVEKQLHQLRHGRHAAARRTLAGLKAGRGRTGQVIGRKQNYFAEHAGRMNYRMVAGRGWPIGSGPVESACLQRQGRFKRSGQFWTPRGLQRLCALIETRQNGHWDALWNQ